MMRRLMLFLALLAPVAVFAAMVVVDRSFGGPGRGYGYVIRIELPPIDQQTGLPKILGPADPTRPLVVIDAGHGGKDPGAGTGALKEKTLTLALALALRDELLSKGGIRVALTRDDDTYVVLPERSAIARRLGADLFLSIHADSNDGDGSANGATIYTLSDKGSNEAAERIAARENAADIINGVKLREQSDAVSSILVDLSQRETQTRSEEFARLIRREGQGRMLFRERAEQSGAFVVLKSPDMASVLFEAGFINNQEDAERLNSEAGRRAFAQINAQAIRVFFARLSGQQ
jgi:N-acetylmuramoyl-L-alanine amidase